MMSVIAEEPKLDPGRVKEVSEAYMSSLTDLTMNSKPLISMLTMLAEENIEYASIIVDTIEKHIVHVRSDFKLPILYLIDSIVKNLQSYRKHVNIKIVNIFCDVFGKVNEQIREKMFQLRQTWNDVFPQTKLFTLDVKVNSIDPNWPITAQIQPKSPAIHVNPNFFPNLNKAPIGNQLTDELKKKQFELIELERKKQELERTVSKKTQNVQNQQQQKIPQMARAPVVGAPMPPVASLPKIPKVSVSRKDPRLNKGNNATSSSSRAISNGDGTTISGIKRKRTDKPKSDNVGRKRSNDERHSSKSNKSSPTSNAVSKSNSESSSVSATSPNKRTERKRHRSPQINKTFQPKRSRERSPEALHEHNKRDKKVSSTSSHRSNDKSKSKASPSPKTILQTGDVDLRVPIKTKGKSPVLKEKFDIAPFELFVLFSIVLL